MPIKELANLRLRQHPLRRNLNDEIHARPPVAITPPLQVIYFGFRQNGKERALQAKCLENFCQLFSCQQLPNENLAHMQFITTNFTLKWEQHHEFSSYTVYFPPLEDNTVFKDEKLISWIGTIPGEVMSAVSINVSSSINSTPDAVLQTRESKNLVVSKIAAGKALIFTDFRINEDGFSHFELIDFGLSKQRLGRIVQRILEIEIYRLMALLAFPVAKEVGKQLYHNEQLLAEIIFKINDADTPEIQQQLLTELTKLAAEQEKSIATTSYRFSAANAYYQLVNQRIIELKENSIEGYSSIRGFMERRLSPAMSTCQAVNRRQNEISKRIARTSELLRTRVNIEMERQNQSLLLQMNNRAKLQLRLQETVEGLSVVVLTYYASQLINYLAKGAKSLIPYSPDVITAISIPVIAILFTIATFVIRKKNKKMEKLPISDNNT